MSHHLPDPAWQQQEAPDWSGYNDEHDDEDGCGICGNTLDDGEGWDGLCGSCADKAEANPRPVDDHDRRYDDMYSTREGDIGDGAFPCG